MIRNGMPYTCAHSVRIASNLPQMRTEKSDNYKKSFFLTSYSLQYISCIGTVNCCVRGAPSRSEICLARTIPGLSAGSALGDWNDCAAAAAAAGVAGAAGGGGGGGGSGGASIAGGCSRRMTVV